MRRNQIYFIAVLLLIIVVLFGFQYVFSIYEVEIRTNPEQLYADNKSECVIQTIPLNSLGMKVPFRKASAKIEIKEGLDLVEVIDLNPGDGMLRIRAKHKPGIVQIYFKPEKALLPTLIEIRIEPNLT